MGNGYEKVSGSGEKGKAQSYDENYGRDLV